MRCIGCIAALRASRIKCRLTVWEISLFYPHVSVRDVICYFFKVTLYIPYTCDFCPPFQYNFCRARIRDKNRKCKLAAISMGFVAAISQRFQTCSKLCMQLGGKTEVNMAHKQGLNCIGIAAGLHLQKLHWNEYVTIAVNRNLSNCEKARRKGFRDFNGIRTRGLCVSAAVFYQPELWRPIHWRPANLLSSSTRERNGTQNEMMWTAGIQMKWVCDHRSESQFKQSCIVTYHPPLTSFWPPCFFFRRTRSDAFCFLSSFFLLQLPGFFLAGFGLDGHSGQLFD